MAKVNIVEYNETNAFSFGNQVILKNQTATVEQYGALVTAINEYKGLLKGMDENDRDEGIDTLVRAQRVLEAIGLASANYSLKSTVYLTAVATSIDGNREADLGEEIRAGLTLFKNESQKDLEMLAVGAEFTESFVQRVIATRELYAEKPTSYN